MRGELEWLGYIIRGVHHRQQNSRSRSGSRRVGGPDRCHTHDVDGAVRVDGPVRENSLAKGVVLLPAGSLGIDFQLGTKGCYIYAHRGSSGLESLNLLEKQKQRA